MKLLQVVVLVFVLCQINLNAQNSRAYGNSASCHINVACEEAQAFSEASRSVVMILDEDGDALGTGTLLNNTREDGRPLILTSNVILNGNENRWQFVFDYQSSDCFNEDPGVDRVLVGARVLARNDQSDFALLEMLIAPSTHHNPYYAGWSIVDTVYDSIAVIHHPQADIKKIALRNDTILKNDSTSYYAVVGYDLGATEFGSSGAPLFNKEQLLVGTLSGGMHGCKDSVDFYGRLYNHWSNAEHPLQTLKYYLDPDSTGVASFHGLDASVTDVLVDVGVVNFENVHYRSCINRFNPKLTLKNYGSLPLDSVRIAWSINDLHSDTSEVKVNLDYLDAVEYKIGNVTLPEGQYQLSVAIEAMNDSLNDENNLNDVIHFGFEIQEGNYIRFDMTTDQSPEENALFLYDANGSLIAFNDGFDAEKDFKREFCLEDGCYQLVLTDEYADGICCESGNGSYTISNALGTVLNGGASFGDSAVYEFCFGVQEDTVVLDTLNASIEVVERELVSMLINTQEIVFNKILSGELDILVFDVYGRFVFRQVMNDSQLILDAEILPKGVLVFQVIDSEFNNINSFKFNNLNY